MLSQDELALLLGQARELRARVDELDDRAEIDAAVRAHVQDLADPPEPPPRHGELIAAAIELLENDRLSPARRRRSSARSSAPCSAGEALPRAGSS